MVVPKNNGSLLRKRSQKNKKRKKLLCSSRIQERIAMLESVYPKNPFCGQPMASKYAELSIQELGSQYQVLCHASNGIKGYKISSAVSARLRKLKLRCSDQMGYFINSSIVTCSGGTRIKWRQDNRSMTMTRQKRNSKRSVNRRRCPD